MKAYHEKVDALIREMETNDKLRTTFRESDRPGMMQALIDRHFTMDDIRDILADNRTHMGSTDLQLIFWFK